jgi:hypothetical protein
MEAWELKAEELCGTLGDLIVALCADFCRREDVSHRPGLNPRCRMEYEYLNYRIYEGASEVVGERYARLYINEIGKKIGFAQSKHTAISERMYKLQKKLVKYNIARKLHLVE